MTFLLWRGPVGMGCLLLIHYQISVVYTYIYSGSGVISIDITVTLWSARWCLKSPASRLFTQPFIQAQIKEKHQSSASLAFFVGNSPLAGEFPAQMASNAENISIWWRHHGVITDLLQRNTSVIIQIMPCYTFSTKSQSNPIHFVNKTLHIKDIFQKISQSSSTSVVKATVCDEDAIMV